MLTRSITLMLAMIGLTACAPPPPAVAPGPEEATDTQLTPAAPGVGKRGQELAGRQGALVTPINAYFNAQQRIAFELQIPYAMRLFEAANGFPPRNHDEFMREIIEANQINLPELPEGDEYSYDPLQKQLMVKQTRRKPETPK